MHQKKLYAFRLLKSIGFSLRLMRCDAMYHFDVWMNFHLCISQIAYPILLVKTPIFAQFDKHTVTYQIKSTGGDGNENFDKR